jgi:drug/metabolite transporter (DMT)-like permease
VDKQSNLRGILFMVLAGAFFVANDTPMKIALQSHPPLQVLMLRGLAGVIWCVPLVFAMGHGKAFQKAFSGWVMLRSLCELAAILAFIFALARLPLGDVTAIYQISPLLVILAAAWLFRIPVRPWQVLLVCLAMAGSLLIAQPGGNNASWYMIFPFITAIGAAARDLTSRKVPQDIPGIVVAVSTIIVVFLASSILHAWTGTWIAPSRSVLLMLLAAGLLLTAAHTFVFLAFRHASIPAVAPFGYSSTGWAVMAGFLVFNDVPNALGFAGMGLIVASGVVALLAERGAYKS